MAHDQEKRAERDAVILLLDECGFSEHFLVQTTWAPVGQMPILPREGRWKKLSVIGALSFHPFGRINEQFHILSHNPTLMDFVNSLFEVHRGYGKPIVVVWDRLSRHRKTEVFMKFCDAHWIEFYQLPSHAPELNPVEGLWSCTNGGELANFAPRNLEE